MRRNPPFGSAEEEMAGLRVVLSSCPGVNSVKSVEAHRRCGYVAVMDFSRDQLESFIAHLEGAGWMSVFHVLIAFERRGSAQPFAAADAFAAR
jgi:hypothetical protein